MSEVKPVAWATALALLGVKNAEDGRRPRVVLLSRECAGGRRIGLILDADHERVVAELREKLDEQVQITARIANENASNRLRAERAEARVAELERQFRENARKAREQAEFGAAGAWDDAATAIEQQLAALQGGEA